MSMAWSFALQTDSLHGPMVRTTPERFGTGHGCPSHRARCHPGIAAMGLTLALGLGCTESETPSAPATPEPAQPAAADAGPAAGATPPVEPPAPVIRRPKVSAIVRAAPAGPADAGSAAAASPVALDGPELPSKPGPARPDNAWTLPETPDRLIWTHPPDGGVEVRLVDGRGLPWPSEVSLRPTAESLVFSIKPTLPLQTGREYVLIAERQTPSGSQAWTVPMTVERGSDQPPPWKAAPPQQKKRRRRRRR